MPLQELAPDVPLVAYNATRLGLAMNVKKAGS